MQQTTSFESQVRFAFALAIAMVAGLSFVIWHLANEAAEAARQVVRTQKVMHGLAYTRSATLQIELSTQSFRITAAPEHLQARDLAIARREQSLDEIGQWTVDNAAQQARWQELRAVLAQRLAMSRQIEVLRAFEGRAVADAYVASAPLQETRLRAHRLLDAMEEDESHRLELLISNGQEKGRLLNVVGGAMVGAWLAMLAATYGLIRRQLKRLDASSQQLEDSEGRLAITLRCIADGVMTTDVDGRVTRINPAAERMTGWTAADAIGRHVDAVFALRSGTNHVPLPGPLPAVMASGEPQNAESDLLLLARDGSEHQIAYSATPKQDLLGHIRGMVLAFRDVTLERRAKLGIEAQNRLLTARVDERTEQLRQSEAHLRSVTSNVPAMIAYVDAQQRYVYVNKQYEDRFASQGGSIVGRTVCEVLGEARYAIAEPMIKRVLQGEPQTYDWQPFPDVWQVISYVPQRDVDGKVSGYYVLGSDITERKRSEAHIQSLNGELAQRVRELERTTRALHTLSAGNRTMLRAVTEAELLDGMCEAIVSTGGYGMAIVWFRHDDAFGTLMPMAERGYPGGLAALRLLRVSWREGEFSGGAAAHSVRNDEVTVVGDMASSPKYGAWRRHLGGQRSALACPLRVDGRVVGALAIYDVEPEVFDADEAILLTESADDLAFGIATLRSQTQQEQDREALYRLTYFDALTGLPNEAQFAEGLRAAIERSQLTQQPFAALQINIDRLREVNDALGFKQGDQMLREFGARLRAVAPEPALVARLRGDEFAILISDSDRTAATTFARRVADVLSEPFQIADIPLDVSSKTGVALFPEHGATPHDFFRHMDIAVQQARQRGLRQTIFDPVRGAEQPGRLSMASELRRAIEEDQLRLYLQPKVELFSGRVCGAEALVRWQHPMRGMVSPQEFIELAEHTGLIRPLTEWMIRAVLQQNRAWAIEGGALPIAVNLSARNLRDVELQEQIRRLLAEFAAPRGTLELEITESAVMEDAEFALHVLRNLRDMGIPLYLDDFGTGYSSLSYLQRLPVDYIKIDQSFVRDMLTSRDSATIVRSTIDLVHDLGRRIVAEGIETADHWDQLVRLGCDYAQGYFIARPMPAAEFQGWLRDYELAAKVSEAGASVHDEVPKRH
ncbi:EAL domain-containing protein [Roseateles sp.]|uniref:EAL domain-containing protein n=1 Tax=Roseateles sp. TaxID=1971397 RepID=UPI0025D9E43B|nr:EAL domain-containing protein [Roseateles sp.]MBV8034179.1 EAL domain-containing protein [Roseateles sp.]